MCIRDSLMVQTNMKQCSANLFRIHIVFCKVFTAEIKKKKIVNIVFKFCEAFATLLEGHRDLLDGSRMSLTAIIPPPMSI